MSEFEFPTNQEVNPAFNREPGIAIVPGSPYAQYMQTFEQFPSQYGNTPGNRYQKREFPKMLYRAERWEGKPACMAAPPDPFAYQNPGEYHRHELAALRFTEQCQKVVQDEREMQKAMENGWRQTAEEAVACLIARDLAKSESAAHREYEDRNMSDAAKREIAEAKAEAGEPVLAEVPEKPRRGRPRNS